METVTPQMFNSRISTVEKKISNMETFLKQYIETELYKLESSLDKKYPLKDEVFDKGETKAVANNYLNKFAGIIKKIREDMDKLKVHSENVSSDDIQLMIEGSIEFNNKQLNEKFMKKEDILTNFQNLKVYIDGEIERIENEMDD